MLTSLGHESTALGVARLYASLVDVFVLDAVDADLATAVEALGLRPLVTDTVMTDDAGRARLPARCSRRSPESHRRRPLPACRRCRSPPADATGAPQGRVVRPGWHPMP
jgi:hypothetical protein